MTPRPPRPPVAARAPLTKRMRRGHWMAIDFLVAAILALAGLLAGTRGDAPRWLPVVIAVVIFLAIALRRRRPVAAFGAIAGVIAIAMLAPMIAVDSMTVFALAYVLFMVTVTGSRRAGIVALGVGLAEVAGIVAIIAERHLPGASVPAFPGTFALIVAWMTGYSMRQRRAYIEMLQAQAASSAVAEERLRIARELHDVVAHSMSVIAVQAGFGQYVIDASPGDAREALGAIQATSRDALAELRRMLGVLRQQDTSQQDTSQQDTSQQDTSQQVTSQQDTSQQVTSQQVTSQQVTSQQVTSQQNVRRPDAGERDMGGTGQPGRPGPAAPLAPEPGLGELDRLVRRTSGAGISVRLERSGTVRDLPAGIDLQAYRIIQEALTNVVRHAGGGARCLVAAGYGQRALTIDVTDDGGLGRPHPHVLGCGHGLIGMRERAHLCGGQVSAGPLPSGGFRVLASLPIPAPAPAPEPRPQLQPEPQPEPQPELAR